MKYFITVIITITYTAMLAGCCEKEKPTPITQSVYHDTRPADELLVYDIPLPSPPDIEAYLAANPVNRERMLTRQIIMLYSAIGKYKSKALALRKYHDEMSQVVKEANLKEEARVKKLMQQ